jgi:hypothetical protein
MKHEIIYIDGYSLIVSDEEIKEGDCYLSPSGIWFYNHLNPNHVKECKKVIAHRPLTDAPILEGVALLPDWEETEETIKSNYYNELEDRREVAKNFSGQVASRHPDMFGHSEIHHMVRGFIEGYNKAKETYKYTEEDLINLVQKGHEIYNEGLGVATDAKKQKLIDFIQSLQQSKRPKYFECKEQKDCPFDFTSRCTMDRCDCKDKLKITTNLQGQTELVGEYIF